jgi:hypothetical protein
VSAAEADRLEIDKVIERLLDFNGGGDPHDHYPWKFTPYSDDFQRTPGVVIGSISTPNGKRPYGSMHTYWSVAGEVWEPTGWLICALVNRAAHDRFGTSLGGES